MPSPNMTAYLDFRARANLGKDLNSDEAREAMMAVFAPDVEIVEPPSLPQGGTHHGIGDWSSMRDQMKALWLQKAEVLHIWENTDDNVIILYCQMEWTGLETGRTASWPTVQVLRFRDGLIARVEIFHQDTQVILDTLPFAAAS